MSSRRRIEAQGQALVDFARLRWRPIVEEIRRAAEGRIFDVDSAPRREIALVLGAKLAAMKPTAVLEDRLLAGAALFASRKVKKLVLSGTPAEVAVMSARAAEHDVPGNAQILDSRGVHTFESLRNARDAGHARLLIVSQRFHLPRALYIASHLGIDALGVAADKTRYANQERFESREIYACVLAYRMVRKF